jgi:hypothetical protein
VKNNRETNSVFANMFFGFVGSGLCRSVFLKMACSVTYAVFWKVVKEAIVA